MRAMRKVVHRETGRKPPKRLKFAPLLGLLLLCGGAPKAPKARGGRTQKEIAIARRRGIKLDYQPAWASALQDGGLVGWARHVFVDLDQHAPDCRWASFWARFR